MTLRPHIVELFVDDQDKALAFYTENLGFQVKVDAAYGDDRWLTVVSADDPDGVQIKLAKPDEAALVFQQHRRNSGVPVMSFGTEDVQAAYEELRGRGVTFVMEPRTFDYGGTDAVFEDGCGNLLNLHQN